MSREYYAHSENEHGEKHKLSIHLQRTAKLMEDFARRIEYKKIFKLAGLLHDLGKYQQNFQHYLESGGKRGSVPHSSWGAGYARNLKINEISIVIDGHHKGLPNNAHWKMDTEPFGREESKALKELLDIFMDDNRLMEKDINVETPAFSEIMQRELFIRYLFSILVDADWLSTEEHFKEEKFNARKSCPLMIDEMLDKLEKAFDDKPKDSELNFLRNKARESVAKKADNLCGFYSLSLPTGMGKTLISLSWALRHAKHNDLKRIIVVLPFTNIIDQTAEVFKEIFGGEYVLEHHSNYGIDKLCESEDISILEERKKLACENWDYPIIVTTTVQFFESLFSNKKSKCRKVHNIADSVVIFDEVQYLPKEIISPTVTMLKNVQAVMGTSFLFCTATQPAFEKRGGFDGIDNIQPLIDNPAEIYEKTKRVDYHLLNEMMPIEEDFLYSEIAKRDESTLVIVNTKKTALAFYKHIQCHNNSIWDEKYHLSTSMCPAHRKKIIKRIKSDLENKRKIIVSSTQLIEAGVDFDFPVVFRAMAPLESIIQSAGRCNREGKMAVKGKVFLFKYADGGMPDRTYAACAGHAEDLLINDLEQIYRHNIFARYYSEVINLFVDPDRNNINSAREKFNYETVSDAYHLIKKTTESLFIYNYNDDSKKLFHSIEHKEYLSKADYRKMQAFTVNVYQKFINENVSLCKTMPQGFMVWFGNYDPNTGITNIPINPDDLVV